MPYNPGVQFDPSIIQRGWAGATSAIVGGIQDYDKLKKGAKAADAIYALYEEKPDPITGEQKPHPLMPKAQWDALGYRDRGAVMEQALRAHVIKQESERQNQAAQLAQTRQNIDLNQQVFENQLRAKTANDATAQQKADALYYQQQGGRGMAGALNGDWQPVERAPSPQLMQAIQQQQGEQGVAQSFFQDPVSGMRFLGRGNTTLPSGVDPKIGQTNAATVPGYTAAPTGRGGMTYLKNVQELTPAQLLKSYDSDLEALAKDFTMPKEERARLRAEIEAERDKLRQPKAAQSNVTEAEYDKLKPGELYWWNGKQIPKQ